MTTNATDGLLLEPGGQPGTPTLPHLELIVTETDPTPAPGQVWLSRYTTAAHVAVTEVDGTRVRLIPVTVSPDGEVTAQAGRGRWATAGQLHRAYRLTDHALRSAQ